MATHLDVFFYSFVTTCSVRFHGFFCTSLDAAYFLRKVCSVPECHKIARADSLVKAIFRVSTEFRLHGIPRNFLTSEVISAQFRRNSAKFRGIPRNFAGIAPEITSVFRGMPKCHFRGHPSYIPCTRMENKSNNMSYSLIFTFLILKILFLITSQIFETPDFEPEL